MQLETDFAYLSKENVAYLIKQGVLYYDKNAKEYEPKYKTLRRIKDGKHAWSMFLFVYEDVVEKTGIRYSETDAVVDVMREGLYTDTQKYPKVVDVFSKGVELWKASDEVRRKKTKNNKRL